MAVEKTRILVIRFSSLGDVAMTVPVLRQLVRENPKVELLILTKPFFQPLFYGIENTSFVTFDLNGRHKGFLGLIRLFFDLPKVDKVADLHGVLRAKLLKLLFSFKGVSIRTINKKRNLRKQLVRKRHKVFRPLPSVFNNYADVFKELGYSVDLSQDCFKVPQIVWPALYAKFKKFQKPWIGIAPFAYYQSKVYPLDLMSKVIDQVLQTTSVSIFLFGAGKDEMSQLNRLKSGRERVFVVAGAFSLSEELQLISQLDLMVSMDSANAHMAAIKGVKTITLWGATHPYCGFLPYKHTLDDTLVSDRQKYPLLPSSIYGNKTIEGYQDAMRTISPEHVVEKINQFLIKLTKN